MNVYLLITTQFLRRFSYPEFWSILNDYSTTIYLLYTVSREYEHNRFPTRMAVEWKDYWIDVVPIITRKATTVKIFRVSKLHNK